MASALIIVDMQEGFVGSAHDELMKRIVQEASSGRCGPVIATRFINYPDSLHVKEAGWEGMMPGTPETQLVAEVAQVADYVVRKYGYAPGDDLLHLMRQLGVSEVFLCGLETDQCVLATALRLWDAGYPIRILSELCDSSSGKQAHQEALQVMARLLGEGAIR